MVCSCTVIFMCALWNLIKMMQCVRIRSMIALAISVVLNSCIDVDILLPSLQVILAEIAKQI